MTHLIRSPPRGDESSPGPRGAKALPKPNKLASHRHGSSFTSTATTSSTGAFDSPFRSLVKTPGCQPRNNISVVDPAPLIQQIPQTPLSEPRRPNIARRKSHRRTDSSLAHAFYIQASERSLSGCKPKETLPTQYSDDKENGLEESPSTFDIIDRDDSSSDLIAHDEYNGDHDSHFADNPLPYEDMVNPTTELLCLIAANNWEIVLERMQDAQDDFVRHYKRSEITDQIRRWGHVTVRGQPVRLLPLQLACTQNPPVGVVQSLIELDAMTMRNRTTTADSPDQNGRVALHWACDANGSDPLVVRCLINANPSACRRQEDKYGFLPLHIACFRHEIQETDQASIESNDRDNSSRVDFSPSTQSDTNIHVKFSPAVVRELLDSYPAGASVKDDMGWTPLHLVCRTNREGEPLARMLINAYPEGATIRDRDGRLPLHWACCHRFARPSYFRVDDKTASAFVEESPADPAESLLEVLLETYPEGAALREKSYGFLPLHIACASGASLGVIQRLLQVYPIAAKKQDKNGSLPLHIACRANASIIVIRALLDAFSDGAHFQDADCRLPLHWACHVGAPEPEISALLQAFPEGAQLTEAKYGYLPLHVACKRGATEDVIASLLAAFPEAARTRDDTGNLPIHIACEGSGITEAVIGLLLLAFPESLERVDHSGRTPLMLAFANHNPSRAVITGLLQSQPSGWRGLSFPIKLKFLDLGHNPSLEHNVMTAIQRDQEENRNSLLSTQTTNEDHDSDLDGETWEVEGDLNVGDQNFEGKHHAQLLRCVLCLYEPVSHILYPCGHPCLCEECARDHIDTLNNVCPVGRCKFHDAIRVYGKIIGN